MDDTPHSPSKPGWTRSFAILVGLGVPTVLGLLGATLLLAGSLSATYGTLALIEALPILGGGLAGVWGTETLRRRPGYRTVAATVAAATGVLSFLALMVLDFFGLTPYGLVF